MVVVVCVFCLTQLTEQLTTQLITPLLFNSQLHLRCGFPALPWALLVTPVFTLTYSLSSASSGVPGLQNLPRVILTASTPLLC